MVMVILKVIGMVMVLVFGVGRKLKEPGFGICPQILTLFPDINKYIVTNIWFLGKIGYLSPDIKVVVEIWLCGHHPKNVK